MEISLNQLLARAVAIAAIAHQDQLDKAHAPYILHPIRLMMRGQVIEEQIVAVLHDVVEDSDWTLDHLIAEGFPPEIIIALDCLTRRPAETYDQFLDRVLTNPLATHVKRYDLEDNMTLTRLENVSEKDLQRLQRYHRAHQQVIHQIQKWEETRH
ncbi:phosphohydrolase [Leptolyngbyaceae cyanobacterium UHCC 1019]